MPERKYVIGWLDSGIYALNKIRPHSMSCTVEAEAPMVAVLCDWIVR